MFLQKYCIYFMFLYCTALSGLPLAAQEIPEKAICTVCATMQTHDKVEAEKVKAWSSHDGQHYYFCSKNCQERFDGDPLAYIPPVFPRPAPQFSAKTTTGEMLDPGAYHGKVILVDFWATWCKPCHEMMPDLQKLHNKFAEKGLVVLGISIDEKDDAAKKVAKFLKKKDISYPIYLDVDENPAWEAFHVPAIPATYLINRQGEIVAQWIGAFDHQAAESAIVTLLNTAGNE